MSADDDRHLVDRCIARAPGAWRIFVDRFAPTVRALANRYLKLNGQFPDSAELDDIIQDVFKALIRRDYHLLKNYDPTYSFKTYLGVITRTEVHRLLRKRKRMGGRIEDLESEPSPEPGVETRVERDYKTIAGILRIPEASVGQTLYRAKRRLLEKLKGLLGLLV